MKLLVQKNFLYINGKKFSCAIGSNGITNSKVEGDGCTPYGRFRFKEIYYRADKLGAINFLNKSIKIQQDDGWCDDPESKFYNRFVKFPFKQSAEKLFRDDDLYDIVCVIDYNLNPTLPGKGSAIFLHVAHKDYRGTQGCVALSKNHLLEIAPQINKDTIIDIKN